LLSRKAELDRFHFGFGADEAERVLRPQRTGKREQHREPEQRTVSTRSDSAG
jgi:hypothetical protein